MLQNKDSEEKKLNEADQSYYNLRSVLTAKEAELRQKQKSKETIDVQHIELYIGVSKEFNIFELQKALGKRDVYACIKIANYFTANPKSNPIQVTMAMLYTYFTKLLLYHSLNDKSRNSVAVALKVNPFFVDDYFTAGKNYSPEHVEKNISLLREFDLRSKGVGASTLGNEDYMKEFVYKLIH